MFGEPPALHRRIALVIVTASLLAACSDAPRDDLLSPEPTPDRAIGDSQGTSTLLVSVVNFDGTPAVGSAVVVVEPPTNGPIRYGQTDATGTVEWSDLADGTMVCVHARSLVHSDVVAQTKLYPPAIGTAISEAVGDPNQAPVLTGPQNKSVPFTPEAYLENCVANPPVTINGAVTKVKLEHVQAAPVNVQVLDLLGFPRADLQRGIVTQVGQCDDPDAPGYIPWLDNDEDCPFGVHPGFLQSYTAQDHVLNYSHAFFRIEALDNVEVGGNFLDLVASEGFEADAGSTELLLGENLVCDATNRTEDGLGDAGMLDIDWYKWSIGVLYGDELTPDPRRTTVWWVMTAGTGDVTYTSRSTYVGSRSTVTNRVKFSVAPSGDSWVCTGVTSDGNSDVQGAAYCDPFHDAVLGDMIRVTVIEHDSAPTSLTSKEFSVKTSGGESTYNAARNGASRSFTPFEFLTECLIPDGNDDRFGTRL